MTAAVNVSYINTLLGMVLELIYCVMVNPQVTFVAWVNKFHFLQLHIVGRRVFNLVGHNTVREIGRHVQDGGRA